MGLIPAIFSDGILHLDFEVGAQKMVLADVQEGHTGVDKCIRKFLPSLQADVEVLPNVQSPDPSVLQHLICQPPQLFILHALPSK